MLRAAGLLDAAHVWRACLAPAPALELEALALDYEFPHASMPSRAIQAELQENWSRLEQVALMLERHAPFGWTAAYYLKVLLDTCMEKIILLDTLLDRLKPAEVFVFEPITRPYDFRLLFDEQESLYARLLPLVVAARFPATTVVRLPAARRTFKGSRPSAPARLKTVLAPYYTALRSLARRRPALALNAWAVCLIEGGYGLAAAVESIPDRGSVVSWRPSADVLLPPSLGVKRWALHRKVAKDVATYRARCQRVWRALHDMASFRELFTCRGVCFFDIVAGRLEYLVTTVFPELFVVRDAALDCFSRWNVRCVASAFFSSPYTYVLAQVARACRIPVVTVQHSAYGYWSWPLAKYTDAVMSDYKLVGGEGVVRYMEDIERAGCTPIPTGLVPFDPLVQQARVRRAASTRRPQVVYPLASYAKNFVPYSNTRLTVSEYFELNRRILGLLAEFPDFDVRVRPHPAPSFKQNCEPLETWVGQQGWRHITFEWAGSTVAAMQAADLVIIDSPSTVLLQAAATTARIFVLNCAFPMTEEGLAALAKRVTYSEDLHEFLSLLRDGLRRRDFKNSAYESDEFLRLYATFRHDGHSLQRAAAAVGNIALGRIAVGGSRNCVPGWVDIER